MPVRTGRPARYSDQQRIHTAVEPAIAAARWIVIHKWVTYMGRKKRRTAQNTLVAQTLQLGETHRFQDKRHSDASPGADAGGAGRYAWVIVFHDSLSPVSDAFLTKFVVQMRAGWYVF